MTVAGPRLMVSEIQTCGYEGLSVGEFVKRLTAAGTKTVIDVRANPLVRWHGFPDRVRSVKGVLLRFNSPVAQLDRALPSEGTCQVG
jgi:uncharacterized protein (DUF488 family)